MVNQNLIEQIETQANSLLSNNDNVLPIEFQMKDISLSDELIGVNGIPFSDTSLKSILTQLRVKNEFLSYKEKLEVSEWNTILTLLRKPENQLPVIGNIVYPSDGGQVISDIYINPDNKAPIEFDIFIDSISEALKNSNVKYSYKEMSFNDKTNEITLKLLNDDSKLNISNFDNDMWKLGVSYVMNPTSFKYMPFFERMICENGMYSNDKNLGYFQASLRDKKYNENKINSMILHSINSDTAELSNRLNDSINSLNSTNISLAEFIKFRTIVEKAGVVKSKNKKEDTYNKYSDILSEYFNDEPFYKNFGENFYKKSDTWLKTADTSINAYNWLNNITYIGSRHDEFNLDQKTATKLQIESGNFLFKANRDLENLAPKVDINYPLIPSMN